LGNKTEEKNSKINNIIQTLELNDGLDDFEIIEEPLKQEEIDIMFKLKKKINKKKPF
jgi:hypothetical protein